MRNEINEGNGFLFKIKIRVIGFGIVIFIGLLVYHITYNDISNDLWGLSSELLGAFVVWFFGLLFWQVIIEEEKKQNNIKQEKENHKLLSHIKETINGTIPVLHNSGLEMYHSKFPVKDIVNLIENATHNIRILQTWIDDHLDIIPAIRTVVNKAPDIKIEILILDPDESQAKLRATSLYRDSNEVETQIKKNRDEITAISLKFENVQLKHYNDLLSFSAYIIDDKCFMGWYWKGNGDKEANNRNKPHLQINGTSSELYLAVNEHFTHLWEK